MVIRPNVCHNRVRTRFDFRDLEPELFQRAQGGGSGIGRSTCKRVGDLHTSGERLYICFTNSLCYPLAMRRTSVELDDERLKQVQRVLHTSGVKDTIERAFDEVLRADLRRRLAERIRKGQGIDRGDEVLQASRRWER